LARIKLINTVQCIIIKCPCFFFKHTCMFYDLIISKTSYYLFFESYKILYVYSFHNASCFSPFSILKKLARA
jgi:hypothetical protein